MADNVESEAGRPGQIAFATDDELVRRLRQVENQLHDWLTKIPALAREVAAIRQQLESSEAAA
jgi:hypothetical protein